MNSSPVIINATTEAAEELPYTIKLGLQQRVFVVIGVVAMILNAMVIMVLYTNKGILGSHPRKIVYHQSIIDFIAATLLVISQFSSFHLGWRMYSRDVIAFPEIFCSLQWSTYLMWGAMQTSTWNMELLTIERYLSICHPIFHRERCTKLVLSILFTLAWIGGYVCNSWIAINFKYFPETNACIYVALPPDMAIMLGTLWAIWSYFLPLGVIIFCYSRIYMVLKNRVATAAGAAVQLRQEDVKKNRQQRNFVATCMIIGVAYVVCYSTNTITWWQYSLGGPLYPEEFWYPFTVVMTFTNTLVNPIIYTLRLEQFQRGLRNTFCTHPFPWGKSSTSSTSKTTPRMVNSGQQQQQQQQQGQI